MRKKIGGYLRKHIFTKIFASLGLIIAFLIFGLAPSSPIIRIASILLLVVALFIFVLSLTTKTVKFRVGERNFYIVKGLFKHHLLSTHHLLDETKTFWFGTHSMYYEFDKLEIEAKLGLFIKPRLFANGQELERIK